MLRDALIGTDIVEISRIRKLITAHPDRFIAKIFTPKEIEYCNRMVDPSIHFAGRFAAKEAIKKALIVSGVDSTIGWQDMEILATQNGAPRVLLHGSKIANLNSRVSIAHTNQTAIAVALVT